MPPIDPSLRDRTYQLFIQEVPDLLQTIEIGLVNLSQDLTPSKVNRLMRAAHSIKGGAANLGLKSIEHLAHQIEDIFRVLNHPDLLIDEQLERLLFKLYDCLHQLFLCQLREEPVPEGIKTTAAIALATIDDRIGHFIIAGQSLPDTMMLGVDLTVSIFDVDVTRSLDRLEQVLIDPDRLHILAGEFRAQAEVFVGISQMLKLPGLEEIAQATIAALDLHPDRVSEICCFALLSFQEARHSVLKGDRQQGGQISPGLAAFTAADPPISLPPPPEAITTVNYPRSEIIAVVEEDLDFLLEELIAPPQQMGSGSEAEIYDLADIFEADFCPDRVETDSWDFLIDDLMVAIDSLVTPPFPPPKTTKRKPAQKVIVPTAPHLSVRVGVDRLERMNNVVGELLVERNGLVLQGEQLSQAVDELRGKCANFQEIAHQLRQIADSLLVDRTPSPPIDPGGEIEQHFDPLELDRYGKLHAVSQEAIEQIAQIDEKIEDIALFRQQSAGTIDRQKQLLTHLREDLMWARMLPLSEILNRFPRTLHDLSTKFQKPVDLKISGAGVLVDKAAIEKLLDPLVHLLRNAFDHGIEPPAIRQATGKPERGLITINAYYQGSHIAIEIQDDGRGIDLETVVARAIQLGLVAPESLSRMTEAQIFNLIFTPGFSTASEVTELSGRGMGLDIVKEQIQAIKGSISIASASGRGTTFTLHIPLTLTIAQLTICQVGNALYAIPADSIQKIIVPTPGQIKRIDHQQFLHWQSEILPIHYLGDLVTYSIPVPERNILSSLKDTVVHPADWLAPMLLVRRADKLVALGIDRLMTEQELIIKSLGAAISAPSYIFGCTILGDGSVLPVLDLHTLLQRTIDRPYCPLPDRGTPSLAAIASTPSILVVDDSITARQSLCLSLEKSGYRTFQAQHGREALQMLHQKKNEIRLVVCDVEMPNMNGFEFLNAQRREPEIADIPVVMLTSRSSEKHRQFAQHLGAKAYLIKPYLETNLFTTIEQFI